MLSTPPAIKDRKSTRLNSSHTLISYAVFCLKKKIADSQGGAGTSHQRAGGRGPSRRGPTPPSRCRSGEAVSAPRRPPSFEVCRFFLNDRATPEIYPLSLHAALPI